MKNRDGLQDRIKNYLLDKVLIIVLLVMIVIISILNPSFVQYRVIVDILTQSSVKLIVALGMLFVLLTGGTDLAAGRQLGLSAVITATLMQSVTYSARFFPEFGDIPIYVPFIVTFVVLGLFGALNGILVAKFHLPPFIATLGVSTIVYGVNLLYYSSERNNSQPLGGLKFEFTNISQIKVFGEINMLIIIAAFVAVVVWFVLKRTAYGKQIYAVGGNKLAAKIAGVNVDRVLISAYVIESMLVAFAGILEAARTSGANSSYGLSYEFDAISACVVGGASLAGGIGKVQGVVIGVVIFTVINYGLTFIGISPHWQQIIRGTIICIAVAFDMKKNRV